MEELKFLGKFTKKLGGGGSGGGLGRGEGGRFLGGRGLGRGGGPGWCGGGGGSGWMLTKNCSFCENSKKKIWGGGRRLGLGGGGSVWGGGQDVCERRIEVFEKIYTQNIRWGKVWGM